MAEKKFIMIPIPMAANLLTSKSYDDVLGYGIYHSALAQKADMDKAFRQLVYCYYHKEDLLSPSLVSRLDSLATDVWWPDVDNLGYNRSGDFEPVTEVRELMNYAQEDNNFLMAVREWYLVYIFLCSSGQRFTGKDIDTVIATGKKYPAYRNAPYAMIGLDMLIRYMTRHSRERDRVRFVMLMAISSIVGRKKFAATTKELIATRMFGEEAAQDDGLKELYERYTTKRIFNGLKDELLAMGLIKCYHGHAGRVYVSPRYSFNEIVDDIATRTQKKAKPQKTWADNERLLKERLTTLNKCSP